MSRRGQPHRTITGHLAERIADLGLDAYGVIAELARGATSTVYLGAHPVSRERVAIKVLDPFYLGHSEMVHRLLAEHELSRRARHPGLLDILYADQTRHGTPYLVMEYLDGESLGSLAGRQSLPPASIIAIVAQIASAVAALHAAGVVHCDLKPANVFVLHEPRAGGRPRVKVIDYSIARLIDDPPLLDGLIAGTPAYMAPEQWRGAPTARSDVYALGCVLYELVTDAPVFTGALPQLMVAHCERLPERMSTRRPDVNPELERLIVRALAKDPAMRPAMADLSAELTRLVPRARSARRAPRRTRATARTCQMMAAEHLAALRAPGRD